MRGLIWFRDDLRLEDNESLSRAVEECEEILPVYVIDSSWFEKDRWYIKKCGPFRIKFLSESLEDLDHQLKEKGSRLFITTGDPVKVILALVEKFEIENVYASKNYAYDEGKQEERLAEQISLKLFDTSTLFHPSDIPFSTDTFPDVFTDFRKGLEKNSEVRKLISSPSQVPTVTFDPEPFPEFEELVSENFDIDSRAVIDFKGGTKEGWKRIAHYFWQSKSLQNYKYTRNGLIGSDYSSKLSPWLSHGCISAKQIYHEVKRFEQEVKKNVSTYWLVFELIWRDYFRYISAKYGNRIFLKYGIRGKSYFEKHRGHSMILDWDKFRLWKEGRTGQPFIDANMKELNQTGYMSNRGRQNVASYLVHHLGVDWRLGAAWFENRLIDYDPCSNYGNWTYVAGVGNDPRSGRVFNPELQSEKYDKNGEHQALWNQ